MQVHHEFQHADGMMKQELQLKATSCVGSRILLMAVLAIEHFVLVARKRMQCEGTIQKLQGVETKDCFFAKTTVLTPILSL